MEKADELENLIRNIIKEVKDSGSEQTDKISSRQDNGDGIFEDVDTAVKAAKKAQVEYAKCSLETRKNVVYAIRTKLKSSVEYLAQEAVKETGMGRVEDKIVKVNLALDKTPGVEDLQSETTTGSDGMVLYEQTPYGVIGVISPSTNPPSTLVNNAIGMLAAGNSLFLSIHPGAQVISRWLSSKLNEIVREVTGINNLIVTIRKPSIDAAQEMMKHPDISILVVTGGPGVVHQALISGKKTIGAGAGNPPVLVDETANIKKAGNDIVWGASFDNGILCTAEKAVVVIESVTSKLLENMQAAGAHLVTSEQEIQKLLDMTLTEKGPNKKYIGKDASFILDEANISYTSEPILIIMETDKKHPLVMNEMLMPILPIVTVKDYDEGVEMSLMIEQGLSHTSMIHSQDVSRINQMAKVMNTSIFVANGPSFAGIGVNGEGPTTFTIATPTGEGTTTARHFTRIRRLSVTNGFSLNQGEGD